MPGKRQAVQSKNIRRKASYGMKETAEFLFELRKQNESVVDLPEALKPKTDKEAYAVQDELVKHLRRHYSSSIVGYKIGCTSQGAQNLLNTEGPLFGQMLSSHLFESPFVLDTQTYSMIVIEPEFGFQIARDVPRAQYDADSIQPFIRSVMPSIEVVHHRLENWDKFNAPLTIADNAIHGCWIHGEPALDWQRIDYETHAVKLFANNELVSQGNASIALGSPLNVLAWLANTLPAYGHQLKKDDYVTTGVCMSVYEARAREHVMADFGTLGKIDLRLS